jgi:hypothetical protein
MSDSQGKYAGTRYTIGVAMLVVACVFSPAVLLLSRPSGYVAPALALACSVFCVAFAFINWKKHSDLTVPSITSTISPRRKSK